MRKIVVLSKTVHPSKIAIFNSFHNHFKDKYIFKVIFTSETESIRSWDLEKEKTKIQFDYQILESKQIALNSKKDKHFFHINFNIKKTLSDENPDIIIHVGWGGISAWTSLLWCKKNNKKYVLWSESTIYEESWRRTITKPIVKYLVKKSDYYISLGTRSKEYLILLGAKENKIKEIYNGIDNEFFIGQSEKFKNKKEELKLKYGIKTKYVLLYVGRMEEGKGIFEMIYGFQEFQKKNLDFSLLIVGDGSEEQRLKDIIEQKNISNVIFPGYLQQNEISQIYIVSDILTLPSKAEVWGLVINEAMCFGLPILTAYRVGASADLVKEGKNGYIMKENSTGEFVKGLEFIIEKGLIEKNNSLEIIDNFKLDNVVKDLAI